MSLPRRTRVWMVLGLTLVPLALWASMREEHVTDELRRVFVTNWPSLWEVRGEVAIKGPIRQAALVAVKDLVVPPVGQKDTTRFVNGGTITADGFSHMVLSLVGQLKNDSTRAGTVGAYLVPEEDAVRRALDEQGQILLAAEVKAQTGTGTPAYFASDQPRAAIGFPRYSVYLYNTTDKAATVTLYVYLTN
jgi:hypothetical protein